MTCQVCRQRIRGVCEKYLLVIEVVVGCKKACSGETGLASSRACNGQDQAMSWRSDGGMSRGIQSSSDAML